MKSVRRVALVVPALELSGGVPAVADFIFRVAVLTGRFDVRLVSLSSAARDDLSVCLVRPPSWIRGVRTESGTWRGRPFTRVGVFAAELEFQRFRPRYALSSILADCDLIQVVSGCPAWGNAVMGLGKPVSLQFATRAHLERQSRDANPVGFAGRWRKLMTAVTDRLDDEALRGADAIQVENAGMLDYARHVNGRSEADIRYAPPGVDVRAFVPSPSPRQESSRYILCVGRLDDSRKNVGMLLEAYAKLPTSLRSNTRLVLAGSASPDSAFWRRAEVLGVRHTVEFISCPRRDELVRLYQRASAFALTSEEEGLGIVVLEAMACGVPVVATRCGGPESIIADGSDGFLIQRGDSEALSARLQALLNDPVSGDAMGRRARATIESRYAEVVAGQAFVDVWDKLLDQAPPR